MVRAPWAESWQSVSTRMGVRTIFGTLGANLSERGRSGHLSPSVDRHRNVRRAPQGEGPQMHTPRKESGKVLEVLSYRACAQVVPNVSPSGHLPPCQKYSSQPQPPHAIRSPGAGVVDWGFKDPPGDSDTLKKHDPHSILEELMALCGQKSGHCCHLLPWVTTYAFLGHSPPEWPHPRARAPLCLHSPQQLMRLCASCLNLNPSDILCSHRDWKPSPHLYFFLRYFP